MSAALDADGQCASQPDYIAWVTACLERMEALEPGMSRAQLMRVFTTEGGLSTALQRTYVSRDCPYFKVDVTFRHAPGADAGLLEELDSDVITRISKPYLQFTIAD